MHSRLLGYQRCLATGDITGMVYQIGTDVPHWYIKPVPTLRFQLQADGSYAIVDRTAHVAWEWLDYEPRTQYVPRRWH